MALGPLHRTLPLVPPLTVLLSLAACTPSTPEPAATPPAAEAEPAAAKASTEPAGAIRDNRAWWPNPVDLSRLRPSESGNPYGAGHDYAAALAKLDLPAVKAD